MRQKGSFWQWRHAAFVAAVVLVLTAAIPAFAQDIPDTPENRKAAAARYLAATPPAELAADIIRELTKQVPEGQRAEFVRLMQDLIRMDKISKVMVNAMLKHFTAEELDALARFYGSPVGRAITKKFGVYSAELVPPIHAEIVRAVQELQSRQRYR